jgi:hypothetical protein
MEQKIMQTIMMCTLIPMFIIGCSASDSGKVDQGRVISFDKDRGLITIARDVNHDARQPDYNSLPVVYQKPAKPNDMGPEPRAGQRMKLDAVKKQIIIFDATTRGFKTINYTLIDEQDNIERKHPLVYDKAIQKSKNFPIINRDKRLITVYSPRQKKLVTFSVPIEYFSLPDSTWNAGDDVMIYYQQDGKALRLKNISEPDKE